MGPIQTRGSPAQAATPPMHATSGVPADRLYRCGRIMAQHFRRGGLSLASERGRAGVLMWLTSVRPEVGRVGSVSPRGVASVARTCGPSTGDACGRPWTGLGHVLWGVAQCFLISFMTGSQRSCPVWTFTSVSPN
jgi:hypothetical protein